MDKYDLSIMALNDGLAACPPEARREFLMNVWGNPLACKSQGGLLFQRVTPMCGCLTQIRNAPNIHGTSLDPLLLQELCADERIPKAPELLDPSNLQAFAEWQRKMDSFYGEKRNGDAYFYLGYGA